jgi:hypothetical protein
MPGARLESITNFSNKEVNKLEKSETVIIIGDAKDVNRNEGNMEFQVRHTSYMV